MHRRIFQVSTKKLKKDEWITEEDFFNNGFIGSVADYVDNGKKDERDDDVLLLKVCTDGAFKFIREGCGWRMKLLRNGKANYFREKFDKLKSVTANMTLEEFCESDNADITQSLINERFGFYVYNDGWLTLDEFVRNAMEVEEYHVGGILHYHS